MLPSLPPIALISTPGMIVSEVSNAADFTGSIHAPVLWSVIAMAFIPDLIAPATNNASVNSRSSKSAEAGVWTCRSIFCHESPAVPNVVMRLGMDGS
jgi:hypothetical protein